MQEPQLTPAERELEAALGRLQPAGHRIERDRLMFRAGQATMRNRLHLWRAASALLAVAFGVSLAARQAAPPVQGPTYAQSAPAQLDEAIPAVAFAGEASPGGGHYLLLREAVIIRGVDALPATEPDLRPADDPAMLRQLRQRASPPSRVWEWKLLEAVRFASPGASS